VTGPEPVLAVKRPQQPTPSIGCHVDEELKRLDLAISEARRLATEAVVALHEPQAALREASADFVESVARRQIDAARRGSVDVMARLSDDDIAELRLWTDEQIAQLRSALERDIEACDFWIPETSGLSPNDVNAYGAALVSRPKESTTGIPQVLVFLIDRHLRPLRQGLAAIGLASVPVGAEPRFEARLTRAWRTYRDSAIVCITQWADVDERYRASAARFQELRWELASLADASEIRARRDADERADASGPVVRAAAAASITGTSDTGGPASRASGTGLVPVATHTDAETLIPMPG